MADGRTSVPGEPAGQRTQGWFLSPAGVLSFADGPSQVRAFTDRGYAEVDDAEARKLVGEGIRLERDRGGAKGTFDDVRQAVREEAAPRRRARRKPSANDKAGSETGETQKGDGGQE